jgi:hypothetical protein
VTLQGRRRIMGVVGIITDFDRDLWRGEILEMDYMTGNVYKCDYKHARWYDLALAL